MKLLLVLMLSALPAFSAVPDPIVTSKDSYNGYATVSGRLASKPDHPVGISVQNGNTMSSTITDPDGRWSIVFRHLSTQFSVASWELGSPSDRATIDSELPVSE